MNVKLTPAQKINVLNTADVFAIMQQILLRENKIRRAQEHFWIIGLNNKNKILFIELLALGASNRITLDPPDVFRMAIYKLATQAIFVHNHPAGNTTPSAADKTFTDHMLKAGQFLRIEVLDHLIITEQKYLSFADSGLMDELRHNGAWELVDKTKADLQTMQLEIEKEKAEKRRALEIARKMKAKDYNEQLIKELTGLKLTDIRRL
jgi:DNA repair protein RadC